MTDYTNQLWERYYIDPPDKKSIADCWGHGSDHRAYQWPPQIDPRWSTDQKAAYIRGYEGHKE